MIELMTSELLFVCKIKDILLKISQCLKASKILIAILLITTFAL